MSDFSFSQVTPSHIILGTALFGSSIGRSESFAAMDAYALSGGNFLDTTHIYAAWLPDGWGESERMVGEWLRVNGVRNKMIVGTKGGHPPMDQLDHGRCGKQDLEQDLSESLERLGVDRIDFYWLHRDDEQRPVEEIVETLAGFVRDGRISAYGGSNWTTARFDAANRYAREHGLPEMAGNQLGWALANRQPGPAPVPGMLYMDDATRTWHRQSKLPVAAYTAQAAGYFGESNVAWAKAGFQGPPPKGAGYDWEQSRDRLTRTMHLADRKGATANQIALSYLLAQPFPVYPIIGTGNPAHVREAMGALSFTLSAAECAWLEIA